MKMIRTNIMFLQMAVVACAMFASCSSDDNNAEGTKESGSVTSFDQVKYLQNNIVEIDSVGTFVQRVNGDKLNSADSTELSVGVKDIAEAAEMFKGWLSPDTEVKETSSTDYEASLKDGSGNVKETVHFKSVTGDGPTIAEMTFDSNKVMKHFNKVKFIKSEAWPENGGYSKHSVGDLVQFNTFDKGVQKWVCIREAKQGQSGMLMYISSFHGYWSPLNIYEFASVGNAKEASKILRKDWNSWVGYFQEAGRHLVSGDFYWIDDWSWGLGIYAIRLSDGKVDWFHTVFKDPDHHFIQVKTFGLSQN